MAWPLDSASTLSQCPGGYPQILWTTPTPPFGLAGFIGHHGRHAPGPSLRPCPALAALGLRHPLRVELGAFRPGAPHPGGGPWGLRGGVFPVRLLLQAVLIRVPGLSFRQNLSPPPSAATGVSNFFPLPFRHSSRPLRCKKVAACPSSAALQPYGCSRRLMAVLTVLPERPRWTRPT